jgi:Na+/phosphate symporter
MIPVDHKQLEQIGDELRRLGHERRETVERIATMAETGSSQAQKLYGDLDEISRRAIGLMEHQRAMIREELQDQR